jgi:hypothetical protein
MTSGRSDIYGHPELEVDLEEEVSFFSQIRRSVTATIDLIWIEGMRGEEATNASISLMAAKK